MSTLRMAPQTENSTLCALKCTENSLAVGAVILERLLRAGLPQGAGISVRHEVEVGEVDLLAWIQAQPSGARAFFRSPDGEREFAWFGAAAVASEWDAPQIGAWLSDMPEATALSWGAFDGTAGQGEWEQFGVSRITLPLIELCRCGGRTTLAVHVVGSTAPALAALEKLNWARPTASVALLELELEDDGDSSAWSESIDAALAAISTGELEKVVLARQRRYVAARPIDPFVLLGELGRREPGAYCIAIEPQPGRAFVSVSPERLFRRSGGLVESPAIAGTCPRGPDHSADERLAARLLASDKNRREHECVVRRIASALRGVCSSVRLDEHPGILRLPNLQHLRSIVSGELRRGVSDAAILAALHPTPAVCGEPVDRAAAFIRAHEGFARGLFAGPIGVISAECTDLAVGIRSALVKGRTLTAIAGAGIVRGSDADAEWLETARKLEAYDALARIGGRTPA